MKRWVVAAGLAVIGTAALFAWYSYGSTSTAGTSYRLVEITRGDVESVVSTTGTLEPVTTVDVGTQVSGSISELYADFNDHVEAGQVIAVLDTTVLAIDVREQEIQLSRSEADYEQAQREFQRQSDLYRDKFVSESDYYDAEYNLKVARNSLESARISLDRAKRNLSYATIYAPMSGTIVERYVDIGQTVAASLSAPELFLIANDLSQMQILASVDESDIGSIAEGQTARFTVQAYPDETFTGVVRQVRLQSSVEENVVTYSVVVDAANESGKLLPGMTATIDFLIQTSEDVYRVANAALRFTATDEMMQQARATMEAKMAAMPDSLRRRGPGGGMRAAGQGGRPAGGGIRSGGTGRPLTGEPPADMARLWYVADDGSVAMMPVRTGISDGQYTEIDGPELKEGLKVIAGTTTGTTASASNPFQASNDRSGGRPGPPPGMF